MNYELRMKDEGKFGIHGGKAKKVEVRKLRVGWRDGEGKGGNCDLVCILCYKKCTFIVECIPK